MSRSPTNPAAGRPRMFIAQLGTETNSFSPVPTGLQGFREGALIYRDASIDDPEGEGAVMRAYRDLAEADGWEVHEGLCAWAQPGGLTTKATWHHLRDALIASLEAAMPVQCAMLWMHGAMMADGCDDCEGDLLARVRQIVGPNTVVGVELDLHCHLTAAMLANANVLVAYKEYPHTDWRARAEELYAICNRAARGEIRPTTSVFDCRMVGFFPTRVEPMASLVRALEEAEREPGILSASFGHGFPFGDNPDVGAKLWVVTDNDLVRGEEVAERLGKMIYSRRHELVHRFVDADDGLDLAARLEGRVILAERSDNPGGGAPGDNTEILAAMAARRIEGCAIGAIYDPVAVPICEAVGTGTQLRLRIGGKLGPASASPLDLDISVMAIAHDHEQIKFGERSSLGTCAWVRAAPDLDIVLSSIRSQTFSPELFTGLGIDLAAKKVIAVKSAEHFRAEFAPLIDHVVRIVTPQGALQMDFATTPYRKKRDMDFFPRCDDPLSLDIPV